MKQGKVVSFKGRTELGPAYVVVSWTGLDPLFYDSPKAKALSLEKKVRGITDLEELDHTPDAVRGFVEEMGDRDWDVAVGQQVSLSELKGLLDPAETVYVVA